MILEIVIVVLILVFFIYQYRKNSYIVGVIEEIPKYRYDKLARNGMQVGDETYLVDYYGDKSNAFVDMVTKTNSYNIIKPHVINKFVSELVTDVDLNDRRGTTIPRTVSKKDCPYLKRAPKMDLPNGGVVVDVNIPEQIENV